MPTPPISLAQLRDYAYCSMLYYWKHVAGVRGEESPRTTLELAGEALKEAWKVYARRPDAAMREAAMAIWRTWLAREGVDGDDVLKGLVGYAQAMASILQGFESGRVLKRDGSRYKQPRMSHQFKKIARSSGLPALSSELDGKLLPALGAVKVDHPLFGPYGVADAFADSLRMAERLGAPGEAPAREAILGVDVPVQIRLGGWVLPARADMLVIDDPNEAAPSVSIEVHDYELGRPPLARHVGRDLRVIAALHAEAIDGIGQVFGEVTGVTYRHIPSGWTHRRRMAAAGRLTHVLEAAARGIQESVYVPMFLTDLSRCETCAMKAACFNPDGLDAVEVLSPGLAHRSEAVAESVRAVMGGLNPEQRGLLAGALKELGHELAARQGLTSDLPGAVSMLARSLDPVGVEAG